MFETCQLSINNDRQLEVYWKPVFWTHSIPKSLVHLCTWTKILKYSRIPTPFPHKIFSGKGVQSFFFSFVRTCMYPKKEDSDPFANQYFMGTSQPLQYYPEYPLTSHIPGHVITYPQTALAKILHNIASIAHKNEVLIQIFFEATSNFSKSLCKYIVQIKMIFVSPHSFSAS